MVFRCNHKPAKSGLCFQLASDYTHSQSAWGCGYIVKETHMMGLDELRERLDIIDEQMMALLSERATVVHKVADFKRHHNIPVYIPEREASIIERLRALNPGPLSGDAVERIYRTIVEEMRKFESKSIPH